MDASHVQLSHKLTHIFSPTSSIPTFSDYATYAYIILALTVLTVIYSALEQWSSLHAVKRLARSETEVKRVSFQKLPGRVELVEERIMSSKLVPGDIVSYSI